MKASAEVLYNYSFEKYIAEQKGNVMEERKAYKFRIYPNDKCQSEIEMQLNLSKNFYNKLLEKAKEAYEKDKSFRPKR
ncbi:MAG: helix-turn-helix domain-containing protein, partial [Candidatus Micrarchaeaceae archaeon]